MAFDAKCFFILITGICAVESTGICNSTMIAECRGGLPDYGWPVFLLVPKPNRDNFCRGITHYTACLDKFRDKCTFKEKEKFWSYESMGEFICADLEDYGRQYGIISNATYRERWHNCWHNFNISGTESKKVACGECETFRKCYLKAVPDVLLRASLVYMGTLAIVPIAYYSLYFGC